MAIDAQASPQPTGTSAVPALRTNVGLICRTPPRVTSPLTDCAQSSSVSSVSCSHLPPFPGPPSKAIHLPGPTSAQVSLPACLMRSTRSQGVPSGSLRRAAAVSGGQRVACGGWEGGRLSAWDDWVEGAGGHALVLDSLEHRAIPRPIGAPAAIAEAEGIPPPVDAGSAAVRDPALVENGLL